MSVLCLKVSGISLPWTELPPNNSQERIEYHAHHLTRHETPRRFLLLLIRSSTRTPKGAEPTPVLPILSPNPEALDESGLMPYVDLPVPTTDSMEDQTTEAAAHLLSPDGPWHLHGTIKLPEEVVHISAKHPVSNTIIRHCLKFVLRVERGNEDDLDSKGNKKQYDIIVEMPIVILSVGAVLPCDVILTSWTSPASLSSRTIYLASI